jgi:hypothetical protein
LAAINRNPIEASKVEAPETNQEGRLIPITISEATPRKRVAGRVIGTSWPRFPRESFIAKGILRRTGLTFSIITDRKRDLCFPAEQVRCSY